MKKRLLCAALSLAVIVSFALIKDSYSWFVVDDVNASQEMTVGKFDFDFVGELYSNYKNISDKELIVPGENLIKVSTIVDTETVYVPSELKVINHSTVDTQMRIRIEYKYKNLSSAIVSGIYGEEDSDQIINASFGTGWTYNSEDKCWHSEIIESLTTEESAAGVEKIILNSLSFSSETFDNSYNGFDGENIKISVQAKQAYYVAWNEIASFSLT